jgi:K+ transporter
VLATQARCRLHAHASPSSSTARLSPLSKSTLALLWLDCITAAMQSQSPWCHDGYACVVCHSAVPLEGLFLSSNIIKIPEGGWVTIMIAVFVASINLVWW